MVSFKPIIRILVILGFAQYIFISISSGQSNSVNKADTNLPMKNGLVSLLIKDRNKLNNLKNYEIVKEISPGYFWVVCQQSNISNQEIYQDDEVLVLDRAQKQSPVLKAILESKRRGEFENKVSFLIPDISYKELIVKEYDLTELKSAINDELIICANIQKSEQLLKLLDDPRILFADILPDDYTLLNDFKQQTEGSYAIKSGAGVGGLELTGRGVTLGMGDAGLVQNHLDYSVLKIEKTNASDHWHSVHVAGTMVGKGNVNPRYEGYATNANLVIEFFFEIINRALEFYKDYGMTITNNSYSTSFNTEDCNFFGRYNYYSNFVDKQLYNNKKLMHIFAAGNSGGIDCQNQPYRYIRPYGTIIDGGQSSKNAISVGNMGLTDSLQYFLGSSCGPTRDGRLKPEIMSFGRGTISATYNNSYAPLGGSSQSSPAVAGGLALLSEYYKKLNNGISPDGGLLKAIICNTADDIENIGPDFKSGFGKLNLLKASEVIKSSQYSTHYIPNNMVQTYNISVPNDIAEAKFLLYWPDPESIPTFSKALVNNLDLEVIDPDGKSFFPWILNSKPDSCHLPAKTGIDSINNIEQVTLNYPKAGVYQVKIKATRVAGYTDFYLTHTFSETKIQLLFPVGNEKLTKGQRNMISWTCPRNNSGVFDIYLSGDGGMNYSLLFSEIPSWKRAQDWINSLNSGSKYRIKIVNRDGNFQETESANFSILPILPNISLSTDCPEKVKVSWTPIEDAQAYNVYHFENGIMQSIGITTDTIFTATNLKRDTTHFFAVAVIGIDTAEGMRCVAKQIETNATQCLGVKDLALIGYLGKDFGRKYTSTQLTNQESIKVKVKNEGNDVVSDIRLNYSINQSITISQAFEITLIPGSEHTFVFSQKADFSRLGNYKLRVWIDTINDPNTLGNNSIENTVIHAANDPILITNNAATTFKLDFEREDPFTLNDPKFGFDKDLKLDYFHNEGKGAIQTFTGNEMIPTGKRGLTIESQKVGEDCAQDIILTANLSNYMNNPNIKLDFKYIPHGKSYNPYNKVYARGSDTSAWVEICSLINLEYPSGNLTHLQTLPLGEMIFASGQKFSSSTQIKFSFKSSGKAKSRTSTGSMTLDDICLIETTSDLAIKDAIIPQVSCGLGSNEYITLKVCNNTADNPQNVDIYAKLGNRPEYKYLTVESFEAFECKELAIGPFNFQLAGKYNMSFRLSTPTDQYQPNNSLSNVEVLNMPIITYFPYFENFERSNDSWQGHGVFSTWEKGQPIKNYITGAVSGTNCWSTGVYKPYASNELSYLSSPCFDFSDLKEDPILSFNLAYNIEKDYDEAWVEYSEDGIIWKKLGTSGVGYNWYNNIGKGVWDGDSPDWRVASIKLPIMSLADKSRFKIRFVFKSDEASEGDGIAIDNIHIYYEYTVYQSLDEIELFNGSTTNLWNNFTKNQQNIAAVLPLDKLPTGAFRTYNYYNPNHEPRKWQDSYYLDRNYRILALNNFVDCRNFKVRLFFLDNEIANIRRLSKDYKRFVHGYDIKIVKYNGPLKDGNLENDDLSQLKEIDASKLNIYPVFNGYMVEFDVMDFGEFFIFPSGLSSINWPRKPGEIEIEERSKSFQDGVNIDPEANVFPNPASNIIFVLNKNKTKWNFYEILDMDGTIRIQQAASLVEDITPMNINTLQPGQYILRKINSTGSQVTKFQKMD